MKSMILAAGYGKRLGNLTQDTPKPLIKVKGKALIDFHIEKLIAIGCNKIVINVHYLAEKIIKHVSEKYIDVIDIVFSHEENILGTGGGIKNAIKHFNQDDFLVINSDIYSDLDYSYFNNFSASFNSSTKSSFIWGKINGPLGRILFEVFFVNENYN